LRAMTKVLVDKQWNMKYEKLVEFKRTNGHCMVPFKYTLDMSLGKWVNKQRHVHTNHVMLSDRKDLLDEIGFIWRYRVEYKSAIVSITDELRHTKWYNQYEKLVEFERTNGHCIVPRRYEQDMALGQWVINQRSSHTNDKIRHDRKELLDEIGFAWNADESRWNQQYEKLVEFKRRNGHCMVTRRYEQDNSLYNWVQSQRTYHINNKMRPDRKELLDELEFLWKTGRV
jgi:hypothetical protein